jgi:hypothetical protein
VIQSCRGAEIVASVPAAPALLIPSPPSMLSLTPNIVEGIPIVQIDRVQETAVGVAIS